jgi:GNAT superfamily N-acetyltransferase
MSVTRRDLEVVTAIDPADVPVLAEVIAEAFFDLPPSRWLVPYPGDRRRIFPKYFSLFVEHGMHAGLVSTTPERNAVAIWFPTPPKPLDNYASRLADVGGQLYERFVRFEHTLEVHHPRQPHQWLAILAVAPEAQGQGNGSALLDHRHRALDLASEAAYLEAANLADRDFYRRRGWLDHAEPIVLPDSGPPMLPMWRPAKPVFDFSATAGTTDNAKPRALAAIS